MDFDDMHIEEEGNDDVMIIDEFEAAVFFMRHSHGLGLSNTTKLELYALYKVIPTHLTYPKQSTEGPCDQPKPSILQFVQRSKWDVWNSLGDMDELLAMRKYLQLVDKINPNWRNSHVDPNALQIEGDDPISAGFAPAVSKPLQKVINEDIFHYCSIGDIKRIDLIASKSDISYPDSNGRTVLHIAAGKSHINVLEHLLLNYKLDPNAQDEDGYTPLHYACLNGDVRSIQALCRAGADPSLLNFDGESAVDLLDDISVLKD